MVYGASITIAIIVLTSGCVHGNTQERLKAKSPARMSHIFVQATGAASHDTALYVEERLKEQKTLGYVKPYIPVVIPPIVKKAWVPGHKSYDDPSILVGGHWVYLMVQDAKWFVEDGSQDKSTAFVIPIQSSGKN